MSHELTLSVIKADVGGFVGHSTIHGTLISRAKEKAGGALARSANSNRWQGGKGRLWLARTSRYRHLSHRS